MVESTHLVAKKPNAEEFSSYFSTIVHCVRVSSPLSSTNDALDFLGGASTDVISHCLGANPRGQKTFLILPMYANKCVYIIAQPLDSQINSCVRRDVPLISVKLAKLIPARKKKIR